MSLTPDAFVEKVHEYVDEEKYLHARAIIQNYPLKNISYKQWSELRKKFHSNYRLGWDLLLFWDQNVPGRMGRSMRIINKMMKRADFYFERKKFKRATRYYQRIAQLIKGRVKKVHHENRLLYFSVLHSLARSLYGAKRYKESLTVYEWMSPIYPRFKQTLVEKMWAGFMSGNLSVTSGAVASQYSTYFGGVINPETYLIQIYLYKMLCRTDDLKIALDNLKLFRISLSKRELNHMDWAKSNFETLPYVRLVESTDDRGDDLLSSEYLAQEQKNIVDWIKSQYEHERRQLLIDSGKAQSYATIAISTTKKEMSPIEKLPSQDELLKSGLELWPVEDTEDWLDEVGLHRFIGRSQCSQSG